VHPARFVGRTEGSEHPSGEGAHPRAEVRMRGRDPRVDHRQGQALTVGQRQVDITLEKDLGRQVIGVEQCLDVAKSRAEHDLQQVLLVRGDLAHLCFAHPSSVCYVGHVCLPVALVQKDVQRSLANPVNRHRTTPSPVNRSFMDTSFRRFHRQANEFSAQARVG
jgi:hypothetical protein